MPKEKTPPPAKASDEVSFRDHFIFNPPDVGLRVEALNLSSAKLLRAGLASRFSRAARFTSWLFANAGAAR